MAGLFVAPAATPRLADFDFIRPAAETDTWQDDGSGVVWDDMFVDEDGGYSSLPPWEATERALDEAASDMPVVHAPVAAEATDVVEHTVENQPEPAYYVDGTDDDEDYGYAAEESYETVSPADELVDEASDEYDYAADEYGYDEEYDYENEESYDDTYAEDTEYSNDYSDEYGYESGDYDEANYGDPAYVEEDYGYTSDEEAYDEAAGDEGDIYSDYEESYAQNQATTESESLDEQWYDETADPELPADVIDEETADAETSYEEELYPGYDNDYADTTEDAEDYTTDETVEEELPIDPALVRVIANWEKLSPELRETIEDMIEREVATPLYD